MVEEHSKENYSKILEIISFYQSVSKEVDKKQHLSVSFKMK